jgi:hypothetical protein
MFVDVVLHEDSENGIKSWKKTNYILIKPNNHLVIWNNIILFNISNIEILRDLRLFFF